MTLRKNAMACGQRLLSATPTDRNQQPFVGKYGRNLKMSPWRKNQPHLYKSMCDNITEMDLT